MANLKQYRSKRDFQRTPEPAGDKSTGLKNRQTRFVVHKHAARHLHYDLRLEHDGVLESWAVPKGPSLQPGAKRLAVRVEDHPLEYGEFEGVIPEGEYGAGTVMLWDRGQCEMMRRTEDRLDFVLQGQKLRGAWSLVKMTGRAGEEGRNWLLIKRSEPKQKERSGVSADYASDETSVLSGRSMEQIAAARDRTWSGAGERDEHPVPEGKDRKNSASGAQRVPDPQRLSGASRASLPKAPRPQLAILVDSAPEDDGWIHEIKLDGYRILAKLDRGLPTLISRNGKDWTARFTEIAAQLAQLPVEDALLDGEVVALGADGVSSFRLLQEALSARHTAALVYHTFDLLHLNGYSLTEVALAERKRALASLLEAAGMPRDGAVRYTDQIEGHGPAFFSQACRLGLEGIISKRADDVYREGRSKSWLKAKCLHHEELLVGGYTEPGGARSGFGALLLGGYRNRRLVYSTKVGTGFSERQLKSLLGMLQKLEVKTSPFDPPPRERGVHWVRPELVAEVEYTEWTRDGALRYPVFRGLREDRDPDDIELPAAASGRSSVPANPTLAGDEAEVADIRLSHPDRVLYPRQGITKLALAQFYEQIAGWILPGLGLRPLSLVRCPEGRQRNCFLQKHPGETFPAHLPRIDIAEQEGTAPYLYVRTLADLVALVQAGTLELHVWGSRVDDVEHPDQLVFDLDPAPDVNWSEVLRAATDLRERLRSFGLESFVRTTGGKGLHLVVPLVPKADWDEAKQFVQVIAHACAADEPQRLTANMSKAKRQGRIFVDYLRNGRGATAIASYSARAHEGAPVAVPLRWDELNPATRSDRYTVDNLKGRLTALHNDPWDGFETARRPLTADLLAAAGVKRRGRR